MKFRRILLKLSGEQFAGSGSHGIDPEFISSLSEELKETATQTKVQMVIVVGGGNVFRGKDVAAYKFEQVTAHYLGMLGGIINGMALVDYLEAHGQPARLQTRLRIENAAEPYIRRKGLRHMEKGRILVVAGGTGIPYFTHDTAAVITALELGCQAILKATKVDGVYDKDPKKHANAKKYESITYSEVLQNPKIGVMDNAAVLLAMENELPIIVFELLKHGNLKKVIQGETVGSRVTN